MLNVVSLQFLNLIDSQLDFLEGVSVRHKAASYTRGKIIERRHLCLR
jgi:hypothetical protein